MNCGFVFASLPASGFFYLERNHIRNTWHSLSVIGVLHACLQPSALSFWCELIGSNESSCSSCMSIFHAGPGCNGARNLRCMRCGHC